MQCPLADLAPRPTGFFKLGVYRHGILIDIIEEANMVVDGYALIQAKLLGGSVSGNSVTQIGVGTNNAGPSAGNTGLTDAFTKALGTVSYPATNQVSFAFSIGPTEANGMAIGEFGLLTGSGALYARKTRPTPLAKDNTMSLAGSWIISFPFAGS